VQVEGGTALSAALLGRPRHELREAKLTGPEKQEWHSLAANTANELLTKKGLDPGRIDVLLHVRPMVGLTMQPDGSTRKKFADEEMVCPLQVRTD